MNVSIITVAYNSEKTIKDTIESVLNQINPPKMEYLIIDGKSSDDTLVIIKSYQEKFEGKNIQYQFISEEDKGIYNAMNKGIKMAKGELIGIINSDDWYSPKAINKVWEEYRTNCIKDIVLTGFRNQYTYDKQFKKTVKNNQNIQDVISKKMPVNHPSTFVSKSIYNAIGNFNEKYKLSADYDLIFRIFNAGYPFEFLEEVIANMRAEGATAKNKNLFISANEDYVLKIDNGVNEYYAYFFKIKRYIEVMLLIIRNYFIK